VRRRAAKRDGNERAIIDALEAAGAWVDQRSPFDLVVCHKGWVHLIEIKDPTQAGRKLTDKELADMQAIRNRGKVHVVETVEQALSVLTSAK
jgi:hypothetical protein